MNISSDQVVLTAVASFVHGTKVVCLSEPFTWSKAARVLMTYLQKSFFHTKRGEKGVFQSLEVFLDRMNRIARRIH